MRGVFTAGALDFLMDKKIYFPYTIGVSAGACNGLSYASRQRGRAKRCNIDLLDKYHYIGFRYFFTKRSIMDFDLIFDDFPTRIIPYDYDTYFASPERFVMVTSNCRTGEANYFEEKHDPVRLLNICRASCSLPFVCPISYVDGEPMLDGGICDAIPIRKAIADGFDRNVVILKNKRYNETLDFLEQLEREKKVILIRPEKPLEVDRIEQDVTKLTDLYNQGYECARKVFSI